MNTQPAQRTRSQRGVPPRRFRPSQLVVVGLLLSVLTVTAACAQQTPGNTGGPSDKVPSTLPPVPPMPAPTASGSPTSTAAAAVDLSVNLTDSPDATPRVFRLVADGSTPSAESTLPDPAAALAAVKQYGAELFFKLPDPDRICTQQYGGPEVAIVTGWFDGKPVNTTFKRTNGCEISSWQALAPLFGAPAGSTGAN